MPIAHRIQALVAVLGFAAVISLVTCTAHINDTLLLDSHSQQRWRRSPLSHHENWYGSYYNHSTSLHFPGQHLSVRENQNLLRRESIQIGGGGVDCCPSVLEMIEPEGGKNQEDQYVELYRDGEYRQRFYELSCHQDILGQPCRFMDRKLHNQSRCVQKHTYTYALVKEPGTRPRHHKGFPSFPAAKGATWTLDYIRVRAGCSCMVDPPQKKRDRAKHHKRKKSDSHD